jgi:hypothetical protein
MGFVVKVFVQTCLQTNTFAAKRSSAGIYPCKPSLKVFGVAFFKKRRFCAAFLKSGSSTYADKPRLYMPYTRISWVSARMASRVRRKLSTLPNSMSTWNI